MSDKAEKKPDAKAEKKDHGKEGAAPEGGAKSGGLLSKTPVILGAVMLIEAVVLFAGFKFLAGGPKPAAGAELATSEKTDGGAKGKDGEKTAVDPKLLVELPVVDFRAPNKRSGRTFLYDVSIYVSTQEKFSDRVKERITACDALIKDRLRTIIAESDPDKLGGGTEPGLETLRRQVKFQLDEIIGDDLINEVLVPRCIPFRTDY